MGRGERGVAFVLGLLLVSCGWRDREGVCWKHRDCVACQACVNGACVAGGAGHTSVVGCDAGAADSARGDLGAGEAGEAGAASLLGDYFTCKAPDCATLDNDGLQLRPDRIAVALLAPGELLESGEAYCELATDAGSYSWDGQNLRVDLKSGTLKGTVDAKAGIATISWMSLPGGGNVLTKPVYMKRVPPRSTGSCK